MAYISIRLLSQVLQHGTEVDLYFPNDYPASVVPQIRGVITLLHGFGGTSKDWFLSPGYAQKKLGDWRSEARIVTEQTVSQGHLREADEERAPGHDPL